MSSLRDLLADAARAADYRHRVAEARRFADQLGAVDGATIANDVVLNQVLVSFDDTRSDRVINAVQRSGECWMGATTWHGTRLMRISVCSWRTTEADVDRSVAAILAARSTGLGRVNDSVTE